MHFINRFEICALFPDYFEKHYCSRQHFSRTALNMNRLINIENSPIVTQASLHRMSHIDSFLSRN